MNAAELEQILGNLLGRFQQDDDRFDSPGPSRTPFDDREDDMDTSDSGGGGSGGGGSGPSELRHMIGQDATPTNNAG